MLLYASVWPCSPWAAQGKAKLSIAQGRKAETIGDYEAALTYYQQALKADPNNSSLKIKVDQIRFEASELHIKQGLEMRRKGDLQGGLGRVSTGWRNRSFQPRR